MVVLVGEGNWGTALHRGPAKLPNASGLVRVRPNKPVACSLLPVPICSFVRVEAIEASARQAATSEDAAQCSSSSRSSQAEPSRRVAWVEANVISVRSICELPAHTYRMNRRRRARDRSSSRSRTERHMHNYVASEFCRRFKQLL